MLKRWLQRFQWVPEVGLLHVFPQEIYFKQILHFYNLWNNYTNTEYILMYCYLNVLISTMIRWPIIGSEEGWQIQHWNIYICRLKSWKKNLLRNTILQYVILLFFLMLQQNLDIKYQVLRQIQINLRRLDSQRSGLLKIFRYEVLIYNLLSSKEKFIFLTI